MWSIHPTPGLEPACFCLKMVLMASLILIWMIILNGSALLAIQTKPAEGKLPACSKANKTQFPKRKLFWKKP